MDTILDIVKARLGRMDTALDRYLESMIEAAKQELREAGIHVRSDSTRDDVLVADFTVWKYQNRDKPGAMPEWLRTERRERWLQDSALRRKEEEGV